MRAALLSVVFLTGCAGIGLGTGMTNSMFDPIEASRYADIAYQAKNISQHCADAQVMETPVAQLQEITGLAVNYSSIKIVNARLTKAGTELKALVDEMDTRYSTAKSKPTEGYCKLKLAQIALAAETIARSIGKKEE